MTFLSVVILTSSTILVYFTARVLGFSPIGWASAVILEIGILTLTVMSPDKTVEWWCVKLVFTFFIGVSFVILHDGARSENRVDSLRLELAEQLVENSSNMPKNHTTTRLASLMTVSDKMGTIKAVSEKADMSIRIVLMLVNLIFAHAAFRLVSSYKT